MEQIVYVPVKAFLDTKVALQSPGESAGAECTAKVEIETGGEAKPSSPANTDVARAVERDQECIRSVNGPRWTMPQRVYRHCQIRSINQVSALPVASSAEPITSA